ncbi:MAG: hypothetical protein JJE44_05055 [Flavobacteriaceae bacterium]|nr:hypothetical protein [Flavobacteriaceae bacterium]
MKTKILIAVLSIGLFSASTMFAQEKEQTKMNHEHMEKATYTCPMHADVKSDKPGVCPKCGMDLKKMEMEMDNAYTCPMHADVKSDKPGACPKCGMDLKKMEKVAYACPMKCEGEKTYDKVGSCPKCNMDLKEIEKKK